MRKAYKVWSAIAAGVFVVVAVTDMSRPTAPKSVAAAATQNAATQTTTPATPPATAFAPAASGAPTPLRVTRVIDGDTVEVSTGRTIQILGIDACEPGTYGGDEALANARSQLEGEVVNLRTEPGVDTDRHGYDLRYLGMTSGGDFGEFAVAFEHTAPYADSGAAPAYIANLKSLDDGPQRCAPPAADPVPDTDESGSIDWPSPGDQGLPDGALTGGYCAKKWWC